MPVGYSADLRATINKAPKTLGNQLGRWAAHHEFSVTRISKITGAARQTVYHWITGGQVRQGYHDRVKVLLDFLRTSPNAEQVWKKACQRFNIKM
jgi:hypothetical protein